MGNGLKSLLFCLLTIGAILQSVYAVLPRSLNPLRYGSPERKIEYKKIYEDFRSKYYQPLCDLNKKEFKGLLEKDQMKDGSLYRQFIGTDTLYEIISCAIIEYISASCVDRKSLREAFLRFEPSKAFDKSPLNTYLDHSKDLRDMLYSDTYIRKVCSVFLGFDKIGPIRNI